LFAATGSLCIVCYDGRRGSPTFGCVNELMLGERNQGLIVIPPRGLSRLEEHRRG
jgi:dTDP-4-dehydrorhamnose 3,5-epimerase